MLKLSEVTWQDIDSLDRNQAIFILPLGSTEQHGERMPLGTDHLICQYYAEQVAEQLSNSVLMPAV